MLFIDKYKPSSLDEINYDIDTCEKLKHLAKDDNFPHIILKGQRGTGKRLKAMLFLKEKYGEDVIHVQTKLFEYKVINKTEPLILPVLCSKFHYQLNLSSFGIYDRILLDFFLKEIVTIKLVNDIKYRIIIIEDTDILSLGAQQSLRRTLETRILNTRFIFIVNNEADVIDPLFSRCITLNIIPPSNGELKKILDTIILNENIENCSINSIIKYSANNVNTALISLYNYKIKSSFTIENDINSIYETLIKIFSIKITSNSELENILLDSRQRLTDLLKYCLEPNEILTTLFKKIIKKLKLTNKQIKQICKLTSSVDVKIKQSIKPIYHLEQFFIGVLNIITM